MKVAARAIWEFCSSNRHLSVASANLTGQLTMDITKLSHQRCSRLQTNKSLAAITPQVSTVVETTPILLPLPSGAGYNPKGTPRRTKCFS